MMAATGSPSFIASLVIVLLCLYFFRRDAPRGICQTHPEATSTAGFMGTKTPYSFLQHIQRGAPFLAERDLDGCRATKMYAVLRHGARYPTAKRAAETERFKTLLLEKLGPEFPEFTASTRLRPATQFMHHGDISALGMKEQFCLAARLKQNFPYLLNEPYSMHHYQFRSSQTSRSFKSALSFAAGLFRGEGPLDGYQPIHVDTKPVEEDTHLRFDEHDCPLYDRQVTNNKTLMAEFDKLLHSPSMLSARDHLQTKLDPAGERLNVSIKDVLTLFKLCVDETSERVEVSRWCGLLSPRHLATLHQYHNIKAFWKKSRGLPITGLRSVHLVKDIVDFFSRNSSTKVSFKFGHSETLLPLLSFLELPFSDLKHFDTTIISPFSANAVFVLYSCSSSADHTPPKLFVSLLVNESPVELTLCSAAGGERQGLCSLEELERAAAHKTFGWRSLKQMCTLKN